MLDHVSVVDKMEIFMNKRLSVTNKLKKIGYQIFTFKEIASHKTYKYTLKNKTIYMSNTGSNYF